MRSRIPAAAVLAGVLLFGLSAGSPAKTRRVVHVALSSFKFEPSVFSVNEGDTVVLQLENTSTDDRPHAFNSPYLSTVDFQVTGQGKQGVTTDGTQYVRLEPGQKAEITFVAKGRGQYGFVCNLYNHAARGQTGAFVIWPAGYHLPVQ